MTLQEKILELASPLRQDILALQEAAKETDEAEELQEQIERAVTLLLDERVSEADDVLAIVRGRVQYLMSQAPTDRPPTNTNYINQLKT